VSAVELGNEGSNPRYELLRANAELVFTRLCSERKKPGQPNLGASVRLKACTLGENSSLGAGCRNGSMRNPDPADRYVITKDSSRWPGVSPELAREGADGPSDPLGR
jgi:hypothetical protein